MSRLKAVNEEQFAISLSRRLVVQGLHPHTLQVKAECPSVMLRLRELLPFRPFILGAAVRLGMLQGSALAERRDKRSWGKKLNPILHSRVHAPLHHQVTQPTQSSQSML